MSVGVACYLVSFYHVSLAWLKTGSGGWSIDSLSFFKEAFPLAAAVVIISLVSYFIITSAVRRYKFYLDSGQDYRTMISLAESIDDLTNPAQIARLSSYPELQTVLRNYGDQVREISRDLAQQEHSANTDELQSEIENLLRGEDAGIEAGAKREGASVLEKVRDHVESNRARIEKLQKQVESARRSYGRAALAYGRIVEAISGAGEGLLAITTSIGELTSVAERLAENPAAARSGGAGSQEKVLRRIVSDMESSVRKLEDGGRVLHEFSEENNGIAINLALMAARGHVNEHDLATFAERVRSTAERFHKLSGTVSSIAQGLLGTCYALKEKIGETAPAPTQQGADPGVSLAIIEIARRIEENSASLQKRICNVGSELHDVHELLQRDPSGAGTGKAAAVSQSLRCVDDLGAASAAHDEGSSPAGRAEESSEFIIDHGTSWGGIGADKPEIERTEHTEEACTPKSMEEAKAPSAPAPVESRRAERESDFADMSSLRKLESPDAVEEERTAAEAHPARKDSWMEMPGHRWLKIDVEKAEVEEETGKIEVTVETAATKTSPAAPAPKEEREEAVFESAEEPPLKAAGSQDNETIYDLFDLGAVEYVEEIPIQR